MTRLPSGTTVRSDAGLYGYERALRRVSLAPIAGADEAGRGPCAGPLVAAAVILPEGKRGIVPGLKDSKLLTKLQRERCYAQVLRRAISWSVVEISATECDRLGMHIANVQALRRAVSRLQPRPSFVLTDGFGVDGVGAPALAVWKGDRVSACIAAASVIAKVTRDAALVRLHAEYPEYGFDVHKGYCTPEHQLALEAHGPCPQHRFRFDNVRRADRIVRGLPPYGAEDPAGRYDPEVAAAYRSADRADVERVTGGAA